MGLTCPFQIVCQELCSKGRATQFLNIPQSHPQAQQDLHLAVVNFCLTSVSLVVEWKTPYKTWLIGQDGIERKPPLFTTRRPALSWVSIFWSVKWEWSFSVLPHRKEEGMSVLENSLQTVEYDMSVKRKPGQYPRTIVAMDVFHQMTGHRENLGGTKQQSG